MMCVQASLLLAVSSDRAKVVSIAEWKSPQKLEISQSSETQKDKVFYFAFFCFLYLNDSFKVL